jgi:hypothetical protein
MSKFDASGQMSIPNCHVSIGCICIKNNYHFQKNYYKLNVVYHSKMSYRRQSKVDFNISWVHKG